VIVRFNQHDLLQCQNQNKSGWFLLVQMIFSYDVVQYITEYLFIKTVKNHI